MDGLFEGNAASTDNVTSSKSERGTLTINVHGAQYLMSSANYATVTVQGMKLKTKKVESEENPIWNDTLLFTKFKPSEGKTGCIKVKRNTVTGPVVVGSASFKLPAVFGKRKKQVIDLWDADKRMVGIVCLEHSVMKCH